MKVTVRIGDELVEREVDHIRTSYPDVIKRRADISRSLHIPIPVLYPGEELLEIVGGFVIVRNHEQ